MSDKENNIKVILLGESGVGKTCLIERYCYDKFKDADPTLSAYYCLKAINYNNKKYTFTLWDTCGRQNFRSLTKIFLKDSKIIILVYDITNKDTFLELQFWLDEILLKFGGDIHLILIGNKNDLEINRQIRKSDATKFAETIHAHFAELSAKNSVGLNEFLDNAFNDYLKKTNPVKEIHLDDNDYDIDDDDLLY